VIRLLRRRERIRSSSLPRSRLFLPVSRTLRLDKVLTLRGGPELVAFWAQLGSIVEVVAGGSARRGGNGHLGDGRAGGHAGAPARVAAPSAADRLAVSAPVASPSSSLARFSREARGRRPSQPLVALAPRSACIVVVPGMLNGYCRASSGAT